MYEVDHFNQEGARSRSRVKNLNKGDLGLYSIGDLKLRANNIEGAEEILEDVVGQYGESSRSRHLRILILAEQGRYEDALSVVSMIAEEDPSNPHTPRLRKYVSHLAKTRPSNAGAVGAEVNDIR